MQQKVPVGPSLEDVRTFRSQVRALERQLARSLEEQTSCCGVTMAQCHCLLEIEARGEPTVGELALALDVDASTMSRNLDGMAAFALVERGPNPRDRRSVVVRLAEAGRRRVAEINAQNDEYYAALLGCMTPEECRQVTEGAAVLTRAMRDLVTKKGN